MRTSKHKQSAYERSKANQERWGQPFDLKTDGDLLANRLNLAATEPAMRRLVEPLEQIVVQLTAMTQEVSRSWASVEPGTKFSVSAHAEWEEKLRRFNALVTPHTSHTILAGFRERDGRAVPVFVELPSDGSDANLIFRLIQLARAGLLDRLRRCTWCGIWFFARKPWAECHSEACRKAKFRSTPEYKQENKQDQRDYYRRNLSPYKRYYRQGLSPDQVRGLLRPQKERKRAKKR